MAYLRDFLFDTAFVPRSAPKIDTATNDRRINSATVSESSHDRVLSTKSEIMINAAVSITPDKVPTGIAARLFFDAANPAIK